MPELPEVQTIVNELKENILGKTIQSIEELREDTVEYHDVPESKKIGSVNSVKRRGKYIIIETSEEKKLIIHLRMTGKLILGKNHEDIGSHIRAYIDFNDGTRLLFKDVRTFGKIEIYEKDVLVPAIDKLGLDPFVDEDKFTIEYLKEIFQNRTAPIKNILLKQELIAGIGNIYACEILFHSGISPLKPAGKLTLRELKVLHRNIKEILQKAITHKGTSVSDYKKIDNKKGGYQYLLKVYKQDKCGCGETISKVKQAGRSTYYCEKCQGNRKSASQRFSESAGQPVSR